jgi:hypothetical protein
MGTVEKKNAIVVTRTSLRVKNALIEIARNNGSDLSKVANDAFEFFIAKAKGKKIVRKVVLKKK